MKRLFSKSSKNATPSSAKYSAPEPPMAGRTATALPTATTAGLQPNYVVPPVPHPNPHEHITLLASEDGLLMRPHCAGLPYPVSYVRVSWGKTTHIAELPSDRGRPSVDWKEGVVIYGIVGLMALFNASYLLVITSRSDVGQMFDASHLIYGVKSVVSIPLVKDRAKSILSRMASRNTSVNRPSLLVSNIDDLQVPNEGTSGEPRVKFADEEEVKILTPRDQVEFSVNNTGRPASPVSSGASTPASDVSMTHSPVSTIANRMSFWGRLSKRTSSTSEGADIEESLLDERELFDSIIHDAAGVPDKVISSIIAATAPPPDSSEERNSELEARILRGCLREFTKGDMYFALHFDITRSLQHKHEQFTKMHTRNKLLSELDALPKDTNVNPLDDKVDPLFEPSVILPLWRRVDRHFWWNEWLSKPFMDAGLHSYVTPIMQGYIQISSFDQPKDTSAMKDDSAEPVDYIVISRRSRDRAGLRYQRRGVDDEANVANFVETEVIMRVQRNGISNVFSHVQIRGSIPLFWTQSGYSMKPPPVLAPERNPAQNLDAIKRHFRRAVPVYGPHTIVNLAEQHGKEGMITNAYREYATKLDAKDVRYCEFDFHRETRGLKYENISKLINQLERVFENQGFFWVSNSMLLSKQKGVFRVNCIDCLDRTNVVQSAFARHVMSMQLEAVGLLSPPQSGKSGMEVIFNDVWANNGDAISRAYAGTSALKGDFTRTGKRDLGGMLNDGVNSLARMYSATFSDWFCQAIIDFMLGYRTLSVFEEFLIKLQSTDPRELIRLSRIRAEAIATSVARVLSEGETLISGWTIFSPEQLNVKFDDRFEEKVLLLSARALYIVSYDYSLEKTKMYICVPLGAIARLEKGAYIISPLEEASRDPVQNAGFSIYWHASNKISMRMTSYSIRNCPEDPLTRSPPAVSVSSSTQYKPTLPRREPTKTANLSGIMSKVSENAAGATDVCFAAFKALPVDPARVRSGSSTGYAEPADDLAGATTCKQVVDMMVDSIKRACEDAGNSPVITDRDVVSLTEAQKMTSIYAKMEYGVKRLIWLGGLV
ncbi:phosphoinositide polyphosphatase [Suillus fuscotomentosus]|uniref:SacI homology domain-containing protein n=1 Tax=Suillus fuscotomentosus TaxID=1912939 RepID=A0AAD4EF00_9AGAM|nr:phosphoinositide polyphosphatase [Suillus fuscotomentosus]KAG1903754.1 SacI homology domain-containing protein [Suillus fuscotomentosus]